MSFWIKKYQIELNQLPMALLIKSIIVVFVCIIILFSILLLLPIQDKIRGEVIIHPKGQPQSIVAPSRGFLNLLKVDNEEIKRGDLLATIEVEIDQETFEKMDQLVNQKLRKFDFSETEELTRAIDELLVEDFRDVNDKLLGLQEQLNYLNFLKKASNPEKLIDNINRTNELKLQRIRRIDSINLNLQKVILTDRENLRKDENLMESGNLSQRSYDDAVAALVEKESRIIQFRASQNKLREEVMENEGEQQRLNLEHESAIRTLAGVIYTEISGIREAFQSYKNQYLIFSPSTGYVSMQFNIVNQEMVDQGDLVMYLLRLEEEAGAISEMYVGAQNAGKIKKGMRVRVGLSEFDQKEYGIYYTTVRSVSEVQQDDLYKIVLNCDLPLETSYNRELPPRDKYNGQGEILLGKINLLTKISREIQFNKEKYASL